MQNLLDVSNASLLPEHFSLIRRISARAAALDMPCYLVGGFVRDLILEKPISDLDVVVEGDAIWLGKNLVKEFGGTLTGHTKFKTATWILPSATGGLSFVDLITARAEIYPRHAALPVVKASSIENDLRRRDFAINAMALCVDEEHFGELLDPLNGHRDLRLGLIRILHHRSFKDDPTRMLRAIRYEQRYGFMIEAATLRLFNDKARAALTQLSGERLRHEFDLMFAETNVRSMLARAHELNLLQTIHPSLTWNAEIENRFARCKNPPRNFWAIWLMDLTESEINELAKRLDFSSDTLKSALGASAVFRERDLFAGLKPSQCVERLEKTPDEAISVAMDCIESESTREILRTYLAKWKNVRPTVNGDDLKARGILPGPEYKNILRRLRAAWLDGEVKTVEEEARLLDELK